MKSYLNLVGQYAKVHCKKNRITVLCIAIAVCLVTAIFGMADMGARSQIIGRIKSSGNYHVIFKNIDDETAELIGSRVDIAVSGWVQQVEGGTIEGKPLAIVGADEAIAREMNLTVAEGRVPQTPTEALLDRQALEQFSLSLGDKVTVNLSDGSPHDFIIVGTYNDFSTLKSKDAHGLQLSRDGLRQITGTDGSRYYVQFKSGVNMRKAIDEIKETLHLSEDQVSENAVLLGLIGQSRDSFMMQLYLTAAVLFLLVLTAGILMIASSFNMSVLERIQFFGLLRCLGASKSQVKKFVLLEGIRLSLQGIPIGLLAGSVVVWGASAFLKYFNASFFQGMPLFQISAIGLIAGAVGGFLTVILASVSPCNRASKVSPLSAVTGNINQTNVPQAKKAPKANHTRLETAMGINHAFANKKNIFLMTGSFAISIILFLSFTVMVTFMRQATTPIRPYTPDISIVGPDNTISLSTKLSEQIQKIPKVKRAYGRMFAYDVPVSSVQGEGKINLISYEENQFRWAKQQLAKGSIDEVENGTGSMLVVYANDLNWKLGDTITLNLSPGEKEVRVAGMLSTCPFDRVPGTQTVICSEKTFTQLTGGQGYTIIDMQLQKGATDETVSQIRSLLTPQMQLSDRRQSNTEVKAMFYSFAVFIYGFLIVIALITVFNIINSMNTSVSSRMNHYGVMRAVGMSGKQLRRMVTAEAATYACCGSLAGCILGLPIHKFLFNTIITFKWGLGWEPPITDLAIIVGIAVLTTFLAVIGPVKKISKMDIVNVVNAG